MSEAREGTERGGPVARRLGQLGGAALFLFFLYGPDLGLDPLQRKVAATTALTASLWVTVAIPVGAASLFPVALFPLLGVMSAREAAPLYMNQLVLLFIGAFIVAIGLERWGVHKRMALAIVVRVGTSRTRLILGFMMASAFLSLWIANTATTLLMLPIALAVCDRIESEGKRDDRFVIALLLGIAYSASVGGMGTPVGTAPNQEFLGQLESRFPEGPRISFGDWFMAWAPLVLIFVPTAWLLLTRVLLRQRDSGEGGSLGVDVIRAERDALGPMNTAQARMLGLFVATAVLWITRADLVLGDLRIPGWARLFMGEAASDPAWYAQHKNDISDATVATVMAILAFLIPSGVRRSENLMDWRSASKIPWEVLLLLGGGFCIAKGFQVSGLDKEIGAALSPLLEGTSEWVIILAVALFISFLTELTSNTATTAVLLPVLAATAASAELNPLMVMMPATIAASAAFMMPAATPPNAVVFSSRRITVPQMFRTGFLLNLWTVSLIVIVFQLWVRPLWGIESALPEWAAGR
ncbi:MAG: SLC13 family permease [Planctomycetes bacterium]|nr:SLC13 family permease [Planctomycetota bacterium]